METVIKVATLVASIVTFIWCTNELWDCWAANIRSLDEKRKDKHETK